MSMGRGNDLQIGLIGIQQEFAKVFLPPGYEICKAQLGVRNAQAGMEIRTLEIRIDRHHSMAQARKGHGEIRSHEGLANAPLAGTNGDHSRPWAPQKFQWPR
jgi:hypothetical protein